MRAERLTYKIWHAMHARCENPAYSNYIHYGARGIKVCARWSEFDMFVADMGLKPDGMCIDRIDVNGGYQPDNCRWVTRADSNRNRRDTRFVTHEGRTACLSEWAEAAGLSRQTLWARLRLGWRFEDAVAMPVLRYAKRATAIASLKEPA